MQLPLLNFDTLVRNAGAALQGACARLLDLSTGSVLRALLEANASVALWMQWIALLVLRAGRASTSTGADLDSWVADFGVARLPAVAASGSVRFSRLSAGLAAFIPVGSLVKSLDGTQGFLVAEDTGNPAWDATRGGFNLAAGALSIDVKVVAELPGAAGNVQAGMITQLAGAVAGVDSVVNLVPLAGGLEAETDAALRARFARWIDSRSRATVPAIVSAIESVQQGLRYVVSENLDAAGDVLLGHFTVVVDDGSAAPAGALLDAVARAVEPVRPVGTSYSVRAPVAVPVNVAMMLSVRDAVPAEVGAAVYEAVAAFIRDLPIGASLPLSRLAGLAYAAHPAVSNVWGMTLNGDAADAVPPIWGVLVVGTIAIG